MSQVPLKFSDSSKPHVVARSMDHKATIINSLPEDFPQKHIDNWFGADGFFGTNYLTGVLKGKYFITLDYWMDSEIFAVREIAPTEIITVASKLDSLEEAKMWIKENV